MKLRNNSIDFRYPQQQQQPLVIVLPNATPNQEADDRTANLNEQLVNASLKSNMGQVDEAKDAIVVDANPKSPEIQPKNAVVYLPDEGRFSIGQIITYIPFLPIEINVPDTISWITNLLTGGWFRPQGQVPLGGMKTIGNRGQMPVIVVPYPGPMPSMNQ